MTILDLSGVNLVSFLEFLCVKFIILRKVNVNKTCQSMSICTNSYIAILVMMLVNNLLSDSTQLISIIMECLCHGSLKVLFSFFSFISIKFLFLGLKSHLFLMLIIFLIFSDVFMMIFFEL